MRATTYPLRALLLTVSGWVHRHRADVVRYLVEENRVLKEQLGGGALRLNDDQRLRLAADAKSLGRDTFERFVLVDEDDIRDAMRGVLEHHHALIAGAVGVAVAAFRHTRDAFASERGAIVLCGANVSRETLRSVLD